MATSDKIWSTGVPLPLGGAAALPPWGRLRLKVEHVFPVYVVILVGEAGRGGLPTLSLPLEPHQSTVGGFFGSVCYRTLQPLLVIPPHVLVVS